LSLPESPRLYLLLDRSYLDENGLLSLCEVALAEGVRLLQYRDKSSGDKEFEALARRLAAACSHAGATLIVNDRAPVAARLGLGLHVGQDDLSPALARSVIGPEAPLGISTHSLAQARAAFAEPVDYIACGPLYATGIKPKASPVGLGLLEAVAAGSPVPVVGIGGITPERAGDVLRAGADYVAVVSAVAAAKDPAAVIRRFIEIGEGFDDKRQRPLR